MSSTLDDILVSIGRGKFYWLLFVACSSWGVFGSMHLMLSAFLVPQSAEYECRVAGLRNATWTRDEIRNFSIPRSEKGHSKCLQYDKNFSAFASLSYADALLAAAEVTPNVTKCARWTYDTSLSFSTLISEFDLVCERQYLRSAVQSVFMAGVLVSALLGGFLADKYGRVRLILVGFVIYSVSGLSASFSTSLEWFLVARFFVASSGNFVYLTSYILMLEWCLPRQRSVVGLAFSVPFALGIMLLPLFAYYLRDWRLLSRVISISTNILVFSLLMMLESPRWLIQNGKLDQAVRVINQARKINGKPKFEAQYLLEAFSQATKVQSHATSPVASDFNETDCCTELVAPTSPETKPNFKILKKKYNSTLMSLTLIKFCFILSISWFICNMVYYGISLSAGNFGVNPFLYMFFGGLMEIPSCTLIVPVVVKYGRRIPLICFFIITGVAVLSSLALPPDKRNLAFVILIMFGKLNITSAFQLLYLHTSEILPTNIRIRGVGVISMVGRMGAIVSPIITDVIGPLDWRFPVLVFGCSPILAGCATFFLPETYKKALPDTAQDVEGWNQKDTARNLPLSPIKDPHLGNKPEAAMEEDT